MAARWHATHARRRGNGGKFKRISMSFVPSWCFTRLTERREKEGLREEWRMRGEKRGGRGKAQLGGQAKGVRIFPLLFAQARTSEASIFFCSFSVIATRCWFLNPVCTSVWHLFHSFSKYINILSFCLYPSTYSSIPLTIHRSIYPALPAFVLPSFSPFLRPFLRQSDLLYLLSF